ncbi:MAG: WhiB family transcriptional regulator [Actinomycetes bacterium]
MTGQNHAGVITPVGHRRLRGKLLESRRTQSMPQSIAMTSSQNTSVAADLDGEDKSWQDMANCLGVDPDLFFPERGASTREAKEVCKGCVVRDDCLEYALANGEKFGIWGGMSERERRRIRRQRALARAAAAAPARTATA